MENTDKKAQTLAESFYYGGAASAVAAGLYVAARHASYFSQGSWQELTIYVKYPWEATGVGELLSVLYSHARDKENDVKLHYLERVGRTLRPANLFAMPLAAATGDNALYSLVATGALTAVGHTLEYLGSKLRGKRLPQYRVRFGIEKVENE